MNSSEVDTSCRFKDLGLIEYQRAWDIQKETVNNVIAGGVQTVFFCEHPAIFTLGRLGAENNILASQKEIEQKGIQTLRIDRGGEVTLHSPGQLVIYPILDLNNFGRDLKFFLEKLEQVAIDLLEDFGILANSISGRRGVWTDSQKIVSIGIGVRKWVSFHGMAINVNTDLSYFNLIRPCGLNVQMTSMQKILKNSVDMRLVKNRAIVHFCEHFNLKADI